MATKISKKIKNASDRIAQRFTSPKSEFDDTEFAPSAENYDLRIEELDYVNRKISRIDGNADLRPHKAPKQNKTPIKTTFNRSQWKTAQELKAYFPDVLCSELTTLLCQLQPTMPDKIKKIKSQIAIHISALPDFIKKNGLQVAGNNNATKDNKSSQSTKAQKLKKSKKQINDADNIVYIIGQWNKSVAMD